MGSSQTAMLVNVLHRVRSVEESQSRSLVMLNNLGLDVENATSRIHELEFSHKATLREMNNLLQKFGEQMAISRRNEQEKVRLTFLHLREEMVEERNTCRLLQMQNKKLSEDLTHASLAAAGACEELNRERKARELLEEVCNELAREIGEDKAEVEQLKQEQEESRERLEKELKLMRMAALWREEKVRNKLEEAKLELEYDGKQGMPLHQISGKPEASNNIVVIDANSGFQEEINSRSKQEKVFTQALEKMENEKTSDIVHNIDNVNSTAHLTSVPAWLDAHFSVDTAPDTNNQLNEAGGTQLRMDANMNGISGTRKHRKLRRRLHKSGQQGESMAQARPHDVKNSGFWEAYCGNSACPSSDDEADRRNSIALQICTPRTRGLVSKPDSNNTPNLHDKANLVVEDGVEGTQATQATQARKASFFSSLGKHTTAEVGPSPGSCLFNDPSRIRSPKKHSSSARFEVGKLGCKSEADTGPRIQHCFSEDDASSFIGRTEGESKQDRKLSPCLHIKGQKNQAAHIATSNDNGIILKATSGGEVGSGNDSELDDFYFEPVKGPPTDAYHNKPNCRAIEDEDGVCKPRPEKGFGKCGDDDACCGVVAKCSQVCKELKADDEKVGCKTVLASLDTEENIISGGQETLNRMSPWRSATGKPLQCLWPPSPDAFSIFGGSKRRSKAGASTSANVDNESGLHLHARRQLSPAKQAVHELPVGGQKSDLLCMRSNSLGAELIKARACDSEKPAKSSFRFSPLRRASSQG